MDAYTVKKILPRLIVAVIAVQLSYFLVGILIDVFNVLGNGVGSLILAPTGSAVNFSLDFGVVGDTTTIIGAAFALANLPAILTALVPLIFVALLAVLSVLFTLVFRQVLIAVLVITAPIAFVAWILPNTERFFKTWWDFLLKALMMYPLIVALLATGALVSTTVAGLIPNTGEGENALYSIVQIVVAIAPFLLIPFTFKFAGGALAAVAGGIQSLQRAGSKPLTDMSKQRYRDHRLKAGQGGTWSSRLPVIGGAVRYANAPYFSSRGARGAQVKAATGIAERSKEIEAGNYSIDQLKAMAYGSKDAMRREQARLTALGTPEARKAAGDLEEFISGDKSGVWGEIRGSTNPVDSAAAAQVLASNGFADEGMTRAAGGRFGSTFGGRVMEDLRSKSIQAGTKSAVIWGNDNAAERTTELGKAAGKLSREDISTTKDWAAMAGTGGGFDTVLTSAAAATAAAGGGPLSAEQQAAVSQASALETNMRQALHPLSGTSAVRQAEITTWLRDHGLSTEPIEPPASPVNVQQIGGQDVPPSAGGDGSMPVR